MKYLIPLAVIALVITCGCFDPTSSTGSQTVNVENNRNCAIFLVTKDGDVFDKVPGVTALAGVADQAIEKVLTERNDQKKKGVKDEKTTDKNQ